jgi:hypothetical protein
MAERVFAAWEGMIGANPEEADSGMLRKVSE